MKNAILLIFLFTGTTVMTKDYLQVGKEKVSFSTIKTIKKGEAFGSPRYSKMSLDDFTKELTDFYLIVNDAKTKKINQKPIAKYLMDKALYDFYIRDQIQTKYNTKNISSIQLRKFYKEYPNIKFSRLVIFFPPNNKKMKKRAYTKLSVLRGQLKQKAITFNDALKQFPNKGLQSMNGVYKNKSILDLPPQEMGILKLLKTNQYSPIIQESNFVALYQLNKIYKYSAIRDKKKLKRQYIYIKTKETLKNKIKELKKKTTVKIY